MLGKMWKDHKKVLLPMLIATVILGGLALTGNLGAGDDWGFDSALNGDSYNTYDEYPEEVLKAGADYEAEMEVEGYGEIGIELFEEKTPKAVNNFVFLAQENFYDGLEIYYLATGELFQTGSPDNEPGGGPGYTFEDEIIDNVTMTPYSVAYANSGADSNGSQFFLLCGDVSQDKIEELDGKFTVFGRVGKGRDVVDAICELNAPDNKPPADIVIKDIDIDWE
jgi:cyclophilin family peptidyl-prolyl cis-trans isomerase